MTRTRRLGLFTGCGCLGALAACLVLCVGVVVPPATALGTAAWRESSTADAVAPGRFLEVEGQRVHVSEWGPPDGPPIVLISGTSAWGGTWVEVAVPLAEAGFHVVAPDLPPFGYSARPPSPDGYTREAQAARILGVLAALDRDDVVLVGHSFGGGATVEAAMRAPAGQVGHLVLIDVALGLGMPPSALAPVASVPVLGSTIVASTFTNPGFLPIGLDAMVHDPAVVTDERVARYARPLVVEGTTAATTAWVPELLAPTPTLASDATNYPALGTPTTVIWGAEDHATPLEQAEHLVDLLPDATLVVLDDVGHLPQIEDPGAVVATLRSLRRR
jgi:2-hydroxymuconate-semialdehyde hydrolase